MPVFVYIWALWQTDVGKVIICLLVGYFLIYLFGWWIIPIVIVFGLLFWLYIYLEERQEQKEIEKEEVKRILHSMNTNTPSKKANKKVNKGFSSSSGKSVLKNEPVDNRRYQYKLVIGKSGNRPEEFDNKTFKVRFEMARDFCGIKVTITNNSTEPIEIIWPSFVINKSRVHIDGIVYVNYIGSGVLAPGETACKLIQPHKLYWNHKFEKMFDEKEMREGEVRYDVWFDVKDNKMMSKTYIYNLYTMKEVVI